MLLVTSPAKAKGMECPHCAPHTKEYMYKIMMCVGMCLGWDSSRQGTGVGQDKEADGARVDGEGV